MFIVLQTDFEFPESIWIGGGFISHALFNFLLPQTFTNATSLLIFEKGNDAFIQNNRKATYENGIALSRNFSPSNFGCSFFFGEIHCCVDAKLFD